MAGNRVMQLWTAVISAVLAVLSALGFASPAAAASPVPQVEGTCKDKAADSAPHILPAPVHRATPPRERSLPPTMKQRICAEAHGSSPSCRKLPPADALLPGTAVTLPDSTTPSGTGGSIVPDHDESAPVTLPAQVTAADMDSGASTHALAA
ncbi:DUF6344 domain-containing protein [Streptomyces sp. NPDC058045]|uniref:DUF6344 domain-containing protein n=1 Tax=Streptomyces sp. NPDC058045 TaxID=3346311 RepID=UPI0036EE6E4F